MQGDVRMARVDDLDGLRELLTYMHGEPPWPDAATDQARATLEHIVSQPLRGLMVAERDGVLVGTIDVIISSNLTRDVAPHALIENIVVRPELRRQGIGRALVEAAFRFAEQHRCYKVQLVSANQRDAAHHLYRTMGFDADVSGFRRYLVPV